MRIERLSDHTNELLTDTEGQRRDVAARQAEATALVDEAAAGYGDAYRRKSLWQRLRGVETDEEAAARQRLEEAHARRRAADNTQLDLTDGANQRWAGVQGEQSIDDRFRDELDDDWLLLRGYRNRAGTVDAVLIGPAGVWTIEVKNRSIALRIDGDDWRYDKIDKWGNIRSDGRATDRSGRSWGRIVREVATDLAEWLHRNDLTVRVHTAVVLVHTRSQLGPVRAPGVDHVTNDLRDLLRVIRSTPVTLHPADRRTIAKLVRRDHRFHEERRARSEARRRT
ncbi:MAG: nuclease-related domain-containing protein [Actinomycetota bacterium]